MRAVDLAAASILILLGGVVVADSLRIGIGWGTDGPRSGFFPFWLGVIMISACAAICVQAWRRSTDQPFVTRERLALVLKVLWPATVMVILITPLGLYVASALYMAFYMRWVGRHGWLAVALCAIGIPLLVTSWCSRSGSWFRCPRARSRRGSGTDRWESRTSSTASQIAVTPFNLFVTVLGIMLGTIIGVLPGLGGANGVAILLPLTFTMPPTSAIILLTSLYWGALFGGAITSDALQHSGRALVGGDDVRRLSAGPAGAGRAGAHGGIHAPPSSAPCSRSC